MFADRIIEHAVGQQRVKPRGFALKPFAGPGMPPRAPRKGAKGIAGARYDILHGTLTVRELAMMATRDIAKRYRVTSSGAKHLRSYIAKHGASVD
jgi:hypothetical protein